ncbi:hypothetical protein MHYP_G00326680 [Metynnis hypsauchen]
MPGHQQNQHIVMTRYWLALDSEADDGYPLPMAYSVLRSHCCQKWDIRNLPGEAEPSSDNGNNAKISTGKMAR